MKLLVLSFAFLITLQPAMAQGNGVFEKYKKSKEKERKEYTEKKQEGLQAHLEKKRKVFDEYRRKKNEEFAAYLGKPWKQHQMKDAVRPLIEKELKPVIFNQEKQRHNNGNQILGKLVPIEWSAPKPQPQPEDSILDNDLAKDYSTFTFYGTPMKVRWGDIKGFKLAQVNEKAIAKAYRQLTDSKYNNLMSDCLKLREEYSLCDWAYYQMLKNLAEAACGIGTREAVFLHGFLYQESGYTVRFARSPQTNKLSLLVAINGYATKSKYHIIGSRIYYIFAKCEESNLKVTDFEKKDTKAMRMEIDKLPKLNVSLSKDKRIKAQSYPIVINSRVNKNLVDFFNDYPTSYCNNDFMTRWAYYANTPISEEIKRDVYPILKEKIENATSLKAANMLLDWIQPPYNDGKEPSKGIQFGFPYLYDDKEWGEDRAFFAEETFYYPGSDCEDHAILFSHLVRDLLGLDVVLVYYPGHLATAICFKENVSGDYIMVGNRKFVVADPTYTGAPVGETMPSCVGKETKVILCKR